MTLTPGELDRKVHQLDNDVQSIYEMLASISAQQSRHLNRLTALDAKIDTRCDALDTRIERLETRFDGFETKLDQVLDRLPGV